MNDPLQAETVTTVQPQPEDGDLPLFRREVFQARSEQWMGRITLPRPVSSWLLTSLACCGALATLTFLSIGTYTRHENAQGQLVPSRGLLPVTARSVGIVTATRVHEGQTVAKNEDLVELSGETNSLASGQTQEAIIIDLQSQLTELEALLRSQTRLEGQQHENLSARIVLLEQQAKESDRQLATEQEKISITERRLEKLKAGVKDGTFAAVELEAYQAQVLTGNAGLNVLRRTRLDTEQQLDILRGQLQQLPLNAEAQSNELRLRLLTVRQSLAQNETQRAVVLRSPSDGMVANVVIQEGQPVTVGQRLLSVLPEGSPLQAELWLPSRAVGFLEVGNRVILRYPAFPYQKFGQQSGWVQEISRSATSTHELTEILGRVVPEALYRVVVRLEKQAVDINGRAEALKPGMTVDADVLLEQHRLIEWVLEPLRTGRSFHESNPNKSKDFSG